MHQSILDKIGAIARIFIIEFDPHYTCGKTYRRFLNIRSEDVKLSKKRSFDSFIEVKICRDEVCQIIPYS
jgi:hypothetical protein